MRYREVLEGRHTALFVAPGDEVGIADAILTLLDRPEIGSALAEAGLRLYERLFTMDAFARSVESLYETLTPRDGTTKSSAWPPVEGGGR